MASPFPNYFTEAADLPVAGPSNHHMLPLLLASNDEGLLLAGNTPPHHAAKRSHEGHEDSDAKEDKKKKRPRQVLSCSMCVRRKSKCDKVTPCSACVKRGDPKSCHVDSPSDEMIAAKQPFALTDDLLSLRHRINSLENLVASLAGGHQQLQLPVPAIAAASAISPPTKTQEEEASVAAVLEQLRGTDGNYFMAANGAGAAVKAEDWPSPPIAELLLQSFLDKIDWWCHVTHTPLLREAILSPSSAPSASLPLLRLVLALGLSFLPYSLSPYNQDEHETLPKVWVELAERGATASKSPVVTCCLAAWWLCSGDMTRMLEWVDAGLRKLSTHPSPDDTFASLPASSQLELSTRCFWTLKIWEYDYSYRRGLSRPKLDSPKPPPPQNLSDEDLTNGSQSGRELKDITIGGFLAVRVSFLHSFAAYSGDANGVPAYLVKVAHTDSHFAPKLPGYDKPENESTFSYVPNQRTLLDIDISTRAIRSSHRESAEMCAGRLLDTLVATKAHLGLLPFYDPALLLCLSVLPPSLHLPAALEHLEKSTKPYGRVGLKALRAGEGGLEVLRGKGTLSAGREETDMLKEVVRQAEMGEGGQCREIGVGC